MRLPSPSEHDRVNLCPPSAVLPATRETTRWSGRGVELHRFLSEVPELGREAALERVEPDMRAAAELIDLSLLPVKKDAYAAEVALAYDPRTDTARELCRGKPRDEAYALLRPGEVPGMVDVLGLTDHAVIVGDYKFVHRPLARPRYLRQLRTYALMAARAYGRDRAVISTIRIGDNGQPWSATDVLNEFDLAVVAMELQDLLDRVRSAAAALARGELPTLVAGEHCEYCPAFFACPAHMALVRQFAAAPDAIEDLLKVATREELAAAWSRAKALQKVLERVFSGIQAAARSSPIPFSDGTVLAPLPVEELDPDMTELVLTALYGEDVARAAVTYEKTTSKAAVEAALRKHVLRRGMRITHLTRDTLQAIRDAGGTRPKEQIRRHRPRALPAEAGEEVSP